MPNNNILTVGQRTGRHLMGQHVITSPPAWHLQFIRNSAWHFNPPSVDVVAKVQTLRPQGAAFQAATCSPVSPVTLAAEAEASVLAEAAQRPSASHPLTLGVAPLFPFFTPKRLQDHAPLETHQT